MTPSAFFGIARSLVIYHGRPWKARRLARFYRGLFDEGDLCFDIGAHVGNRSRAMLAAGGRVVALEPQPAFLSFLERFFRKDRMTIVGKGVAAEAGTMTLRISSRHPTVTTLSEKWIDDVGTSEGFASVDWDRAVEVEVTTLDDLIAEFGLPRFCKIDVEGMEAEILDGLSQPIGVVAFEYLPAAEDVALASVERLQRLGAYEYNIVKGEQERFVLESWLAADRLAAEARTIFEDGASGDVYARLRG